jgi:hypothetical protein
MDPITTAIIAALAQLGQTVINDAYQALKAALQHKFGVDSDLVEAVDKTEEKPESEARQAVLQEEVAASGALQDEEVLKAAEALIAAIKTQPGGEDTLRRIEQSVTVSDQARTGDITQIGSIEGVEGKIDLSKKR